MYCDAQLLTANAACVPYHPVTIDSISVCSEGKGEEANNLLYIIRT